MAEEEVVPNNSCGDEKESLSPPEKKQKVGEENLQGSISEGASASKTPLDPYAAEDERWEAMVLRSIMSEEDDALEDVTESLAEYYPSGFCDDPGAKWFKYLRRIVDSEGFDIEMDEVPEVANPGNIPFIPMVNLHPRLHYLGKFAIDRFNQKNGKEYKFVKVEKANLRSWGPGTNLYITLQAVPENPDSAHGLTAFQTLVFDGPDPGPYVKFIRLKAVGT